MNAVAGAFLVTLVVLVGYFLAVILRFKLEKPYTQESYDDLVAYCDRASDESMNVGEMDVLSNFCSHPGCMRQAAASRTWCEALVCLHSYSRCPHDHVCGPLHYYHFAIAVFFDQLRHPIQTLSIAVDARRMRKEWERKLKQLKEELAY